MTPDPAKSTMHTLISALSAPLRPPEANAGRPRKPAQALVERLHSGRPGDRPPGLSDAPDSHRPISHQVGALPLAGYEAVEALQTRARIQARVRAAVAGFG